MEMDKDNNPHIIMEFCDISMDKLIKEKKYIPENEAMDFLY